MRVENKIRLVRCEAVNIKEIQEKKICHSIKPHQIARDKTTRYLEPATQLLHEYDRKMYCEDEDTEEHDQIVQKIEDTRLKRVADYIIARALYQSKQPLEDASFLFNEESSFNFTIKQEYSLSRDLKELNYMVRRALPKVALIYTIALTTTGLVAFIIAKCHLKAGWLPSMAAISAWIKVINDLRKLRKEKIRKQQIKEHKQNNCKIVGAVQDQQICLEDIHVRVIRLEARLGVNC